MNKFKMKLPAIFWMLVILFLSGYPGHKVPAIPVWQFDKLVHTGMYGIFSFLLLVAFAAQYKESETRFLLIIKVALFAIFYGGFMEILQHYIFINRSGNLYDFIANTLGVILGVTCYPYVIKYLPINK